MFENNIVCSYSNERSLSKYLVRSEFTFDNEIPGTFRCNRPVCNTCDFVSHVTVVTGAYKSFYKSVEVLLALVRMLFITVALRL